MKKKIINNYRKYKTEYRYNKEYFKNYYRNYKFDSKKRSVLNNYFYRKSLLKTELKKYGFNYFPYLMNLKVKNRIYIFFKLRHKNFYFIKEEAKEKDYLFSNYFFLRSEKLKEKLESTQPLKFTQELRNFNYFYKETKKISKKYQLVQIKRGTKVPPKNYTWKNPHYEIKSLSSLLWKEGVCATKTDIYPVLDFDRPKEEHLLKDWKKTIDYTINILKAPWIVRTPSGGYHIYLSKKGFEIYGSNLYLKSKNTNYQFEHVGELKAKGGYVLHPFSKGYLMEKTRWSKKKLPFFDSIEKLKQKLKRIGVYLNGGLLKTKKNRGKLIKKPNEKGFQVERIQEYRNNFLIFELKKGNIKIRALFNQESKMQKIPLMRVSDYVNLKKGKWWNFVNYFIKWKKK